MKVAILLMVVAVVTVSVVNAAPYHGQADIEGLLSNMLNEKQVASDTDIMKNLLSNLLNNKRVAAVIQEQAMAKQQKLAEAQFFGKLLGMLGK